MPSEFEMREMLWLSPKLKKCNKSLPNNAKFENQANSPTFEFPSTFTALKFMGFCNFKTNAKREITSIVKK
jgi:hypothetical protein